MHCNTIQSDAKQSKAKECREMQSKVKKSKATQSKAKQCMPKQSNANQCKTNQRQAKLSNIMGGRTCWSVSTPDVFLNSQAAFGRAGSDGSFRAMEPVSAATPLLGLHPSRPPPPPPPPPPEHKLK